MDASPDRDKQNDKTLRLVEYLLRLASQHTTLVRDIAGYEATLWLSDIPRETGCYTRAWGPNEEYDDDLWGILGTGTNYGPTDTCSRRLFQLYPRPRARRIASSPFEGIGGSMKLSRGPVCKGQGRSRRMVRLDALGHRSVGGRTLFDCGAGFAHFQPHFPHARYLFD